MSFEEDSEEDSLLLELSKNGNPDLSDSDDFVNNFPSDDDEQDSLHNECEETLQISDFESGKAWLTVWFCAYTRCRQLT